MSLPDMSHDTAHPVVGPDQPTTTRGSLERAAAECWAALAPLLAGQRWCREARDATPRRRGAYLARWQRLLSDRLPAVPAAVPIYRSDGTTRVLVLDLDVGRGGQDAVARDADAISKLVASAGGSVIRDESGTGGQHVYVPLAQAVSFHAARDLALALATRLPTLDPSPNQNLLAGLIRPPGSRHRLGGFQRLHGPLRTAVELARAGNPSAVWDRLTAQLEPELAALAAIMAPAAACQAVDDTAAPYRPRPGGARDLAHDYARIARTGDWTADRYASPSEARMAVITAAVWAGHTLTDVLARLHNGAWPGLASLYARYPARHRTTAVRRDWLKAHHATQQPRPAPTSRNAQSLVRNSPTSEHTPHGGAARPVPNDDQRQPGSPSEYRWIRSWWGALELAEKHRYRATRAGIGRRIVLRALGEAAMKTGSRIVEFGCRSLSVATGLDHTTVAAHLRALLDEPDPLIDQLENDRGLRADLYTLRIPEELDDRAGRRPWRAGRLQALRPVFRELGHPAALIYEELEAGRGDRRRSFDIAAATGLSRTTVWDTLRLLAAYHLAEQTPTGWTVTATSLTLLADQLGVTDTIRAQIARHRTERAAYRAALRVVARGHLTVVPSDWPPPWDPPPDRPPPEPDEASALDLLQRLLGARLIDDAA